LDETTMKRMESAPDEKLDAEGATSPAAAVRQTAPREAPRQGGRKRVMLALVACVAIGLGGWKGYNWYTQGRFLVGTDDAYVRTETATLAAKVPGHVARVAVGDNARVKAGDLLVVIDDGDYRLAVTAAEDKALTQAATIARIRAQAGAQKAVVAQAEAQSRGAKADATRAALDYGRAVRLKEATFATQQRVDAALADRDRTVAAAENTEAAVAAARANLSVVEAQIVEATRVGEELKTALDKARRDLGFTEIRAPFDGTVGNKAAQPGQYVQPGTRLMALVPLDSVYVEANFKETQIGRLKPGQKALLSVDAYAEQPIEGVVESVAPASGAQFSLLPPENATGNFTKIVQRVPVRVKVPADVARQGLLRPGLSVVVDVDTREQASAPSLARK
jgi:membrane fusion protein (multidrug efflux system)